MNGETVVIDALDQKLVEAFPGRVVRKDLVHKLKVGFSVPVYVLEYLLGKYCSINRRNRDRARTPAREASYCGPCRPGRPGELIKARLQNDGSIKLIDLVTSPFDEKDQGGKYWARLATAGLEKIHIDEKFVENTNES